MNWTNRAAALADVATHRNSRWWAPVASVPRHLFVPRWWTRAEGGGWDLHNGPSNLDQWHDAAYQDTSVITRVGVTHADQADHGDRPVGRPTSSATLPSLVVSMFHHARVDENDTLLDIGTGSGYGAALAARRLGDDLVTTVDVDSYLVDAARERFEEASVRVTAAVADATGPLPVEPKGVARIVATVSVRTIPPYWLSALCVGGRLVTTLAGTSLIVTAEKQPDGSASGRVEWDRAGFMVTRHGDDYPPDLDEVFAKATEQDGDDVALGRYPVVDVVNAWDLWSMLGLAVPGIEHQYEEDGDGRRTALMAHPDGSWARATALDDQRPTVHQSGPQRLWDELDQCRTYWLTHGELPVRGARVRIKPDGTTILMRGKWHIKLT